MDGGGRPTGKVADMTATFPDGMTIDVTVGNRTAQQVRDLLVAEGLRPEVAKTLTVKVQTTYASQCSTSVAKNGFGKYVNFAAAIYLQEGGGFSYQPQSTVAHEYGHAATLYSLYLKSNGDWNPYLRARGLIGDARLESGYSWTKREIAADDYRLLFGSSLALQQRTRHLNPYITDPRYVAGLKEFMAGWLGMSAPVSPPPPPAQPPPVTKTCPTCGGTGKVVV